MTAVHYQDEIDQGIFSTIKKGNEAVTFTSAFPLSPEMTYGKKMSIYLCIYFNSTIDILAVTEEELPFPLSPSDSTSSMSSADSFQPKGQQPV